MYEYKSLTSDPTSLDIILNLEALQGWELDVCTPEICDNSVDATTRVARYRLIFKRLLKNVDSLLPVDESYVEEIPKEN